MVRAIGRRQQLDTASRTSARCPPGDWSENWARGLVGFSRLTHACAFRGCVDTAAHFRGQIPKQDLNFGVNGRFQAKRMKLLYRPMDSNQLFAQ